MTLDNETRDLALLALVRAMASHAVQAKHNNDLDTDMAMLALVCEMIMTTRLPPQWNSISRN